MKRKKLKGLLEKELILWRRDWKRGLIEIIMPLITIGFISILLVQIEPEERSFE